MSWQEYSVPPEAPAMQAILAVWNQTTLEERRALGNLEKAGTA